MESNVVVLASVLLLFTFVTVSFFNKPKKKEIKPGKGVPKSTTPSAPLEEKIEEETQTEDSQFEENEPFEETNKSLLFIKKVLPEFKLYPETHSIGLLNKVVLKNSGITASMKVKGEIKYRIKNRILATSQIGSNVTLGPHQSIILENSFMLPLNEIQYIKVANIIKNKQNLEVPDVTPIMKVDIQYENGNRKVADISQTYKLDFKTSSWRLYFKETE